MNENMIFTLFNADKGFSVTSYWWLHSQTMESKSLFQRYKKEMLIYKRNKWTWNKRKLSYSREKKANDFPLEKE